MSMKYPQMMEQVMTDGQVSAVDISNTKLIPHSVFPSRSTALAV